MAILTKFTREDFEELLEHYDIGEYLSHRHVSWAFANTVYILRTTKGKFLMKIFEQCKIDPDYADFVRYQAKTMKLLEKTSLPSPKLIETKDRKPILVFRKNHLMIQTFVEGKHPRKFGASLLKNVAKNQALMSRELLNLKIEKRFTWGRDYQFRQAPFKIPPISGFDIARKYALLSKETRSLDRRKLRRSMVHGDFIAPNLLVKNNKLTAVIDWDDLHEDFLALEIATFITHTFVKTNEIDKKGLKLYMQEFEKYLRLHLEEKKAVYFFIKNRLFGVIAWHIKQAKIHKDQAKRLMRSANITVKTYKHFDKILLQEFLSMLD